jgi:flagellar protein FlaF
VIRQSSAGKNIDTPENVPVPLQRPEGSRVAIGQLMGSTFQGELSKPDNPLPKKLREDILSLSAFIDKRTFDIMAYPRPEKLAIIININLNLAAGLRGSPS